MGNCFGSSNDSEEYKELRGVAETPNPRNYGATTRVDTQRPASSPQTEVLSETDPLLRNADSGASIDEEDHVGGTEATNYRLPEESVIPAKLNFEEVSNSDEPHQVEHEAIAIEEDIRGGSSGQAVGVIDTEETSEELRIEEQILKLIEENNYSEVASILATNENLLTANLFEEQSLIRYAFKKQNTDLISCIFKLYNSCELDNQSLIDEVYQEIKNFEPTEDLVSIFTEAISEPYLQVCALILQNDFIKSDSLDDILTFYFSKFKCREDEISEGVYTITLVLEMLKEDERASAVYRKILENYARYDDQILELINLISGDTKAIAEFAAKIEDKKSSISILKDLLEDDSNKEIVLEVVAANKDLSIPVLEYMMRKNKLTPDLLEFAVEHGLDPTLNTRVKISGVVQERPFISTINRLKCLDINSLEHKMVIIMAKTQKFKDYLRKNYEKYTKLDSSTEDCRQVISDELRPFNKIIPLLKTIEMKEEGFILSLGLDEELSNFLLINESFRDTGSLISYGDASIYSALHTTPAAGFADDTHTVNGDIHQEGHE